MLPDTWMVETGLRSAALLLLVSALVLLLRRDSATVRHRVWATGLLGVLALPALTVLPWRWEVLPGRTVTAATEPRSTPSGEEGTAAEPATPRTGSNDLESGGTARPPDSAGTGAGPTLSSTASILLLWLVGLLGVLGRLAYGLVTVRRLVRRATSVDDSAWHDLLDRSRRSLALRSYPRLCMSEEVSVPCTTGWRKPVIILPTSAVAWSDERREIVLLHELAHVRRADILSLLLSRVVLALHWFNPLAWLAARRIHAEAERACDELVLRTGTQASAYADHLLAIVRSATARWTPVTAMPMARRSDFEGRLLAILEFGRRTAPRHLGRLAVAATLLLTVPVAAASRGPVVLDGPVDPLSMTGVDPHAPRLDDTLDTTRSPDGRRDDPTDPVPGTPRGVEPGGIAPARMGQVNELITTLADPVADVRVAAASALGNQRDTTAIRALIDVLQNDQDAGVRRAAAWALGQMEEPALTVGPLSRALRSDTSPEVRQHAAEALGNLDDRAATPALIEALTGDEDPRVRREVASALSDLEDPAAVPALATALGRENDPEIKVALLEALGNTEDSRALSQVIAVLRDGNPDVRRAAAHALGHFEDGRAAGPLRDLLRDADTEVRLEAIEALGNLRDRNSAGALEDALGDASAEVRRAAAEALGHLEIRVAPAALVSMVKDPDREVRRAVVHALADIEDPATVGALVEAMKDSDVEVRRSAVEGLGDIGGQAAANALRTALRDTDPEVRKAAAEALGNISR